MAYVKLAFAALFLVTICSEGFCLTRADVPQACCFSYTKIVLPLKVIKGYYMTSTSCNTSAVIFKTPKGEFCANPQLQWVKRHVDSLKKNTKNQQSST
ncbi:C-C motif chemokine 3-like [Protopterus annectens]|uniref:C-C motif chemokine 3-like n=1 Tax=Protopterus annectens TaxID=7888 RepID=UPI001CFA3BD6|nr:C-C motif chemokine 3-like [Protopterus annectens]